MKVSNILFGAAVCLALCNAFVSCSSSDDPSTWDWPDPVQKDTTSVNPSDTTVTPVDTTTVDPVGPEEPEDTTKWDPAPTPDEPEDPSVSDGKGTVVIIGGGASGVSAGLQCARMGMDTYIIEGSSWLGGMLTSAGVTATDGCYYLRGGIFGEFTDKLAKHYGSYNSLKTGWVSNILFEPKVGEEMFEEMCSAQSSKLTIVKNTHFTGLTKKSKGWTVECDHLGSTVTYDCDILIDCTELGDVAKAAGVEYRLGMDSPSDTGESLASGPNDIVQDMTYVMTLKYYDHDVSIAKPDGYDESKYVNCCKNAYNTGSPQYEPSKMLSYGLTPGKTYMINWPISGNDYYANIVDSSKEERDAVIKKAKDYSLGFLYFLQTKLGYNTLGLADDQYPTDDNFPFYPYFRESRRIKGEHLFIIDEVENTFYDDAYRSGIAVGDYPVDQHHTQYPDKTKIPSSYPKIIPYSVPLGCLIPLGVEDLIVAEKSISVSNLVNGTTRLQPVCVELGQAAGALAATALKHNTPVREVSVREVQQALLDANDLLMPYRDALATDTNFMAMQRVGLTGILRGEGKTVGWSNECHFNATTALKWCDLYLYDYYKIEYNSSTSNVTGAEFKALLEQILGHEITDMPESIATTYTLKRSKAAEYIDKYLNPFRYEVDWDGHLK